MPLFRRRDKPSPHVMTAAGRVVDLRDRETVATLAMTRMQWQAVAWNYRNSIGELGQALRMKANLLSKLGWTAAYQPPGEDEPVLLTGEPDQDKDEDGNPYVAPHVAQAAIECIQALPWGRGYSFVGRISTGFDVPGEVWLHGFPDEETGEETWEVRSSSEVTPSGGGTLLVTTVPGRPARELDPDEETLIRLWTPHPEWGELADSPLRTLLDVCEDVVLAGREIRAAAMSRIASNGILFIPESLALAKPDQETVRPSENGFAAAFTASMTAPINNEGHVSAVVPIVVFGDPEDGQYIKHTPLDRRADSDVIDRLKAALDRIADGIDLPSEAMRGTIGEANHWCLDESTEVLTRRGWTSVDDFRVGDEVLALDHASGLASWAATSDLYMADVADEPMRLLEARTHSSLTTLNHRWPTVTPWGARRWRTSDKLNGYDAITTGAPVADLPVVAKYSDALVELVGWFWTEGNLNAGGGLTIAQSHTVNPGRVDSIRRALAAEFGPSGWTERIQPNHSSLGGPITTFRLRSPARDALLEVAPGKRPSEGFIDSLTLAQLHLFIDTSCRGDGHHWRTGERDIWQRDPSALDAYERACILAGYAVSRQPGHDGGTTVRALRTTQVRPVKAAAEMLRTGKIGAVDKIVTYTGRVWCPTVPVFHSYLARRNGRTFYTGNSAWLIDAQTFENHLEPGARMIADSITQSYFRRRLTMPVADGGWGLTLEEAKTVRCWFDASTITRNTNRSADADAAMDRAGISYKAYRKAKGFNEDDAPTEEDLQQIQMIRAARLDPTVLNQLAAKLLGLEVAVPGVDKAPALPPGQGPLLPAQGQPPVITDAPVAPGQSGQAGPPATPVGARTASATDPQKVLDSVRVIDGQQLADIDRQLIESIRHAAEAELAAVLRKAGNKIKASAQGKPELAQLVNGADPMAVGEMVGYDRLAELGLTEDVLLAAAFVYLQSKFAGWTKTAIKDAVLAVSAMLAFPLVTTHALVATMTERIPAAWKRLEASLHTRAMSALYGRKGDTLPDGEVPDTIILPGDIREALAEIGGPSPAGVPGGLALGGDLLREIDQRTVGLGFTWRYGVTPRARAFHPHRQLAGERFETYTDPRLVPTPEYAWLGPHMHPGDHLGCSCDAVPAWAVGEADSAAAEVVNVETQGMRNERVLAQLDDAAGRVGTHSQRTRDERARMVEVQRAWIERRAPHG